MKYIIIFSQRKLQKTFLDSFNKSPNKSTQFM